MSKEKTAIQWLVQILELDTQFNGITNEVIEQAKKMEKQQIIDAANWDSKSISENGIRKGDKYYNETFNK